MGGAFLWKTWMESGFSIEQCAREWMIQSGAMEASEFLQAVADMEDVRLRARLLALELVAMNAKYNVLDTIPWDRLN